MAVCGETLPLGCERALSNINTFCRIGKDGAVEYFRNFKAKGQTNNQRKNKFLTTCFKAKELEIKNNDRECIPGV